MMDQAMRAIEAALRTAIAHIEHMGSYIAANTVGYSFESLGEDMPGMRAAIAAAERVGNIKSLNEEAKGEHCDLDYRPDPADRLAGEDNTRNETAYEAAFNHITSHPRLREKIGHAQHRDVIGLVDAIRLALSPGKGSEEL